MQKPPASAPLVGLIDQDVWVVRHLSEELQKLGLRVLGWTDARPALDLLLRERCDVVVIDDTTSELRDETGAYTMALEKSGAERPRVILHSTSTSAVPPANRAFVDARVTRPCSAEVLRAAILNVMASHPMPNAITQP